MKKMNSGEINDKLIKVYSKRDIKAGAEYDEEDQEEDQEDSCLFYNKN